MDKRVNSLIGPLRRLLGIAIGVPVGITAGILAVVFLNTVIPISVGKGLGQILIFLGAFVAGTTTGVLCMRSIGAKNTIAQPKDLHQVDRANNPHGAQHD